jgi:hypothetical protein
MAELWFSALPSGMLRRGEFTSRADLAAKMTGFAIRCNRTARPYTWTYDARTDHARHAGHDDPAATRPARKAASRWPRNPAQASSQNPSRTIAVLSQV